MVALNLNIGTLMGAMLTISPQLAMAQVQQGAMAEESIPSIGAVNVQGAGALGVGAFSSQIEAVIGQAASPQVLQQLANAISEAAQAQGYLFATVSIPQQHVRTGVIALTFDSGVVDEVRISGTQNEHVRSLLNKLSGKVGERKAVERQILLAEDVPGIKVIRSRYVKEAGRGILLVEVKESPVTGAVALDNWGNRAYGPVRLRSSLSANNLLSGADSLTGQVTSTIGQPRELLFGSLQYSVAPGLSGLTLGIAAGAGSTRPQLPTANLHVAGDSLFISANGSYPMLRGSATSLWLNVDAFYLQVDQSILNDLIQRDRTASFSVGVSGYNRVASGGLNWGVSGTQGLGLFGSTQAGDALHSRLDGSGRFSKLTGWFNWFGAVSNKLSLRVSANGQLASRGLLASQEIGLGGPFVGRGYDFFEVSGDDGVMGIVELRHSIAMPYPDTWAHAYAFVDGGKVWNKKPQLWEGSLASAGGGIRAGKGRAEIGLEGAQPLSGPRANADKRAPQFTVVVGYTF